MSKRSASTRSAPADLNAIEHRHNYSEREKRMCLALLEHEGPIICTPDSLSKLAGFPGAATLRRWRDEASNPPAVTEMTATIGRPPLLSDEKEKIVGGFVLFCAERHQTCGGKEIIDFIQHAFGITVLKSWVSEKMEEIGISSHRPASLKFTFGGYHSITTAAEYLVSNQPELRKVADRSRVVAIDQISFWDCGVSTSTYSAIGAGQPRLWDSEPGEKHIVYEAFTADGSCLPPVIFTTRETEASTEPDGLFRDEKGNEAYVVYIPGLGGPSEKSTAVWLEKMTARDANYFGDDPHIILDSLRGHFTEVMLGDWENVGATLHRLPAASGKWLNPCDQSINREMRREFTRLQQLNRCDKIRNIIRAYYSIKDETITKSFNKCGVFEGDPDDIISAQACQGYRAKGHRDKQLQSYRVAFLGWAQLNTRSPADMLPRSAPPDAIDKGLDGEYWNTYGSSRAGLSRKRSLIL